MTETSDDYYKDQPAFETKDPLNGWAITLVAIGVGVGLWSIILMAIMAADLIATRDTLFGINQGEWVVITTIILVLTIIGLIFVIVARSGAAASGGYLSADLERDDDDFGDEDASDVDEDDADSGMTVGVGATQGALDALRGARVEDPFGRDGRTYLAYHVPPGITRGVYGDVKVRIDNDTVLNIKTRLAALRED